MIEEKGLAKRLKDMSGQRPQRIVIDEKLPNGSFRVLVSAMKEGVGECQATDTSAWEEEEARLVGPTQLTEMIPNTPLDKMVEGLVFVANQRQWSDVYPTERKRLKEMTAKLLVHEGKTRGKASEEK